jgi:hypothetical protein
MIINDYRESKYEHSNTVVFEGNSVVRILKQAFGKDKNIKKGVQLNINTAYHNINLYKDLYKEGSK